MSLVPTRYTTARALTESERSLISLALGIAAQHWLKVAGEVRPQNSSVQALVDALISQAAEAADLNVLFAGADTCTVETLNEPAGEDA